MLSFLGAGSSSLRSLGSSSRSYSSGASTTSQRPALVWNHGHASTKPQQQVQLPESSHGVSSELIAKLRRLREEAPKTFTARRLMSNFNLSKKTINAVAPYVRHGKALHDQQVAAKKAKRIVDSPEVKRERLNAWFHTQFSNIQVHRERRHLYHTRGTKCLAEIDVQLLKDADNRDYHADLIAETARNKKRKTMAASRRKR